MAASGTERWWARLIKEFTNKKLSRGKAFPGLLSRCHRLLKELIETVSDKVREVLKGNSGSCLGSACHASSTKVG